MTREQELETAMIRLLTGIKKENFNNCDWYEGILDDAVKEAEDLLK